MFCNLWEIVFILLSLLYDWLRWRDFHFDVLGRLSFSHMNRFLIFINKIVFKFNFFLCWFITLFIYKALTWWLDLIKFTNSLIMKHTVNHIDLFYFALWSKITGGSLIKQTWCKSTFCFICSINATLLMFKVWQLAQLKR